MFSFLKEKKNKIIKKAGFTLLEMLAVVAIFAILTAVIIFNYGDFTDNILSTNMAYEIGLIARQAQVFGLGVRGTGGDFANAYGIFVNLQDGSSPSGTKNIIFFVDNKPLGGNSRCNNDSTGSSHCTCSSTDGISDECLEKLTLQRSIIVDSLRIKKANGDCTDTNLLAVTFKRPNPDAIIIDQENGDTSDYAEIRLFSPHNRTPRYVIIRSTGQISVAHASECGT